MLRSVEPAAALELRRNSTAVVVGGESTAGFVSLRGIATSSGASSWVLSSKTSSTPGARPVVTLLPRLAGQTALAEVPGGAQLKQASEEQELYQAIPQRHSNRRPYLESSAGAYVSGGRYPLTALAHMTIVTAKVAGVPRVVACTPPIRGEVPDATVVVAMQLADSPGSNNPMVRG